MFHVVPYDRMRVPRRSGATCVSQQLYSVNREKMGPWGGQSVAAPPDPLLTVLQPIGLTPCKQLTNGFGWVGEGLFTS